MMEGTDVFQITVSVVLFPWKITDKKYCTHLSLNLYNNGVGIQMQKLILHAKKSIDLSYQSLNEPPKEPPIF